MRRYSVFLMNKSNWFGVSQKYIATSRVRSFNIYFIFYDTCTLSKIIILQHQRLLNTIFSFLLANTIKLEKIKLKKYQYFNTSFNTVVCKCGRQSILYVTYGYLFLCYIYWSVRCFLFCLI